MKKIISKLGFRELFQEKRISSEDMEQYLNLVNLISSENKSEVDSGLISHTQ